MKHDAPKQIDFKAFYKSPWGKAFIAYFVVMGLVGALTPPDILTAYGWTRPFTDFMASIVPQIDKVTALGIDPDINRFYFSVMWAGSPVLVLLTLLSFWRKREHALSSKSSLFRTPFLKSFIWAMFAFCFFVIGAQEIFWMTDNKSRYLLGYFGTPIGRGAIGQCFVAVAIFMFIGSAIWLVGWLTGYIPRNIRKQNELENTHGK